MALKTLVAPIPLEFIGKKRIHSEVYAFRFKPSNGFTWKAGQHGMYEIADETGKTLRKVFSISSAPSENEIWITTRVIKEASSFKKALLQLKKGDCIKFRGAIGPLVIKKRSTPYALLATGIGITPFRSIIAQAAHEQINTKIYLFYVGNKDHHFFKDDFAEFKKSLPGLEIIYIYKPERIRGHLLEETMGEELLSTTFFLAGSRPMVKAYKRTLHGLGVPGRHIKADSFLGYHPTSAHLNSEN